MISLCSARCTLQLTQLNFVGKPCFGSLAPLRIHRPSFLLELSVYFLAQVVNARFSLVQVMYAYRAVVLSLLFALHYRLEPSAPHGPVAFDHEAPIYEGPKLNEHKSHDGDSKSLCIYGFCLI